MNVEEFMRNCRRRLANDHFIPVDALEQLDVAIDQLWRACDEDDHTLERILWLTYRDWCEPSRFVELP